MSRDVVTERAQRLRRRHARSRRFRRLGAAAVAVALALLAVLFGTIVAKGHSAFWQTQIRLEVHLDPALLDPRGDASPESLRAGDYRGVVRQALMARFPEVEGRAAVRRVLGLVSLGAEYRLRDMVVGDPGLVGRTVPVWVPAAAAVDTVVKGHIDRDLPEARRPLDDRQLAWLETLAAEGALERRFNWAFLANADSREPELAGIRGAVVGSALTLLVTLALSFPLGVAAAVYLEEFAPRNRWTDLIEVNINNLAAVPSIVFGLLGLALLLNVMQLPRSAPLVGGMVLALMTLPTIIIAARASLKSVPPSVKEAALGLGASRMQAVTHHALPLAMPGILTGSIIGMAQALGETAPLLMIGMVAFVADVPGGFTDPATALPVQIFLWADSPERAFVERTSAAIMVLLAFLVAMNGLAIYLRKRFERR